MTLTLQDLFSDFKESISKIVTISEEIFPKAIKTSIEQTKKGLRFFSEKSGMFFDKIRQIGKDKVWIVKEKSPKMPIGVIKIDFDAITTDINLSSLIADYNSAIQKSILYMETWPSGIEKSKILFLPIKK